MCDVFIQFDELKNEKSLDIDFDLVGLGSGHRSTLQTQLQVLHYAV